MKIYQKEVEGIGGVLRIEFTITNNLERYGIANPDQVIQPWDINAQKLVEFRRLDLNRAAELACQRGEGKSLSYQKRRNKYIDLTVAHYRSYLDCQMNPESAEHADVLGQWIEAYRKTPWYRKQDMDKVFPRL